MVTFSQLIRPSDLGTLIDPNSTRKGFQGAHAIGDKFWDRQLDFLDDLGFGATRNGLGNGSLEFQGPYT